MNKILIIVCALQLILFGIIIIYIVIENKKKRNLLFKQNMTEEEINIWRDKLLNKVKEKIYISQETEKRIMAGEDAVAKFIYNKQDIKKLSNDLNEIYSENISSLKRQYASLTELDIVVIILLGIGMDNYEIATLLNMEKRTLYRRRQLISQRMGISSTMIEHFAVELLST